MSMDAMDREILNLLTLNSRMTSSEIGRNVHLSVPAVSERIRKLEEKGIIDQFTVKINRNLLGQSCVVYIFVILSESVNIDLFRQMIIDSEYVLECHHTSGEYDYLLKVAVPDISELEHFITHILKKNQGVIKSNTVFSLSTMKEIQ
ncbi:Lrp/AsnC family leucine-responsive transcriptional regulator [Paenibacillus sp. DS2015]|uniref:Lrp/AsnC family transcriptional regulator n=1 Tax=Paenibacillus sp. DS2015 TaxID=3373917 RepID=UPI003D19E649